MTHNDLRSQIEIAAGKDLTGSLNNGSKPLNAWIMQLEKQDLKSCQMVNFDSS